MGKAKILKDPCIGCGVCESSCPVQAIKVNGGKAEVDQTKCTGCGACVSACPMSCIKVE